jgi:predicted TIM-barrel fold metal-dependent hydrolase
MANDTRSSGGEATPEADARPASAMAGATAGPTARIDVHAHYLPAPYQQALKAAGLAKADGGMPIPDWSVEAHLTAMSARGVTTSMLSVSSPGLQFLDAAGAARLAREINEIGAGLCRDHPGRFGLFATLPTGDITASIAEAGHALDALQADGIVLETNVKGQYLGDDRFAPLFTELDRRGAVVFLHPTSPACLEQIGMGFPGPLIEFPFDTTRTLVDLLFSGTLKRCPNVKVILSHGGGALPILVSRIASVAEAPFIHPRPQGGGAEVLESVRELYFDLALAASPANFQALLEITSLSHILYGSDYPFAPPPAIGVNDARYGSLLAKLPPEQRAMLDYRNAAALFPRLKRFLAG